MQESSSLNPWPLSAPIPESMRAAVARVEAAPTDEAAWDELERLVEQEQRPDVAEAVYGQLLEGSSARELAATLGARAVRFHDEWSGEPEALERLLRAVLKLDVSAEWAFERMTVTLTMGERWGELLSLYDQALTATSDLLRRREILDEAAHIAKDFAGQPERAIGYLWQLVQLRPADASLASSLERLLEARSMHADLARLWELRASVQGGDAARALRLRAGVCWFERVGASGDAVRVLGGLLHERHEEARVVELIERIAAQPGGAVEARREAFGLLEKFFDDAGREEDALRVLEGGLEVTSADAERARAHRKAAAIHERRGDAERALKHVAELLPLEPRDGDGLEALRRLGEAQGAYFLVARVLAKAAERLAGDRMAVALRDEAAGLLLDRGGDVAEAAGLLLEVFGSPEADAATARRAGERLWREHLLQLEGLEARRLPALQRLAELGPGEGELAPSLWRFDLLGEIARVAIEQGLPEQALAAWERRLADDPADSEAIDGRIDALERLRRWDVLLTALQKRADMASDEEARRLDLVRIAKVVATTADDVDRAIEAWREIEANFGREDDTVDSLCELFERAGRLQDLDTLLREAEAQAQGGRRAELRARLGELRVKQQLDEAALESFLAALSDEPSSARARRGLRGLLDRPAVGALALSGLVGACDKTDDWAERLSLLEYRLAAGDEDETKADILVDAAADQEVRAGDLAAAQQLLGRALSLNPGSIAIEQSLLRLAGSTGLWAEVASAFESGLAVAQAQAVVGQEGRLIELQARLGWVYEAHLLDLPRALDAYRRVARVEPQFPQILLAVVRVSVQLHSADATAEALLQATARGHLDPELVAAVEAHAQGADSYQAIIAALEPGLLRLAQGERGLPVLLRQVGLWYRDHLGAPAQAEEFLSRSVALDGSNVQAIEELAALQRARPNPALVATLRALSAARGGDEGALKEAAEVALDALGDEALGLAILGELSATAQQRWQGGEARSAEPPQSYVRWAQARTVGIHERRGEVAEAIQILTAGARLPFAQGEVVEMLHRAASLARGSLADLALAARLHRDVLAIDAGDEASLEALAAILTEQGDHRALIELRRHELGLELPLARRLEARLSQARSAAALGDEALVAGALRDNLREQPGHPVSVEELAALLSRGGRLRELLALLVEQAGQLEEHDDAAAARQLWVRAAELAEGQLGDPSEAIAAQLRAARIAETPEALDALGRLYMARGEPSSAIVWFERRLVGCAPEQRADVVQRLASALIAVGRVDDARRHLEALYQHDPSDRATRSQLLALYRGAQSWPELVAMALASAEQEADVQVKIGLYLDAADVLLRRTVEPARAVEMLRRASELAPQDRGLRAGLADALRTSGQLDEARKILEDLLGEYGRRRPPERAAVHFQLAQLAQAKGDVAEALTQLDTASSMDIAHGGVLLLLGRLAFEARQFERSERAYRALLLILRRQRPEGPASHQVDIGLSEVSFELYRVATQLGQAERAGELLESAFAAAQGPEAARLERALRASGETALLLRSILARKERAATGAEQAAALVDLSAAHRALGHDEEAFAAAEQALALAPDSDAAHAAARDLARSAPFDRRYGDRLHEQAAAAAPEASCALWLRLGAFLEGNGDLGGAAGAYERAAETGLRLVEAWGSIERVARGLGDVARQIEALRSLAELLSGDAKKLTDILYQLAALELSASATEEMGVATLERALGLEARKAAALALLQKAAPRKTCRDLLVLFERTARDAGEQALLLEALELLTSVPGSGDDVFREAVELADELFESARAEALLRAAVEATGGLWAMIALGQRSKNSNDWAGAHGWLMRASERADGDEAFQLGLEAAAIAAGQLKNKSLAIQLYHRLWTSRPGERAAWEPLLGLLRGGDAEMLDGVLAGAAAASPDKGDRRRLRMERAEALLDDAFRQEDAVGVLQEILQEEPSDADAQALLLRIYEQTGRADDLAALLQQQLAAACEQRSLDEISNLALRLGGLLAKRRRDDAMEVYRQALGFLPNDPVLLRELLGLLGSDGDPAERARLLDRLLLDNALPDAPKVALQLADVRAALRDDEGLEAALRRGLALAPDDAQLRARIEAFYTDRARWRPLAELLINEASNQLEPLEAAARLQKAALLLGKKLNEHRAAVDLLRRARALASEDLNLLRALVDALLDAGDNAAASDEVRSALERTHVENSARAQLLRLSALLAVRQGKEAEAVAALEQAIAFGAQDATPDLIAALEQLLASSVKKADVQSERAATLRLASLFLHASESEKGLALLRSWAQRQPGDLEALRTLLDLETAIGNWPAVVDLSNRLIAADPDETKVEAALRLLDACTRAGAPENARTGLETAFASFPKNVPARNALKQLYEQLNAQRELADILLHEAADIEDEASRFAPYRRAAELYLAAGFAANAVPVLEAALHAKPGEHECVVLLVDCYISMSQLELATNLLDSAIAGHKNKRSPQLSILQHRMARVALAAGDRTIEVQWLNAALDSDAQNGQIATELADVATEIGQYDLALKALRAITVAKNPGPMSKGMAFYRQGLISYHQGDQRKAVVMAKRGLQEDPSLAEARTFLEQLGEKV